MSGIKYCAECGCTFEYGEEGSELDVCAECMDENEDYLVERRTESDIDINEYILGFIKDTDGWVKTEKARKILHDMGWCVILWSWEDVIYRLYERDKDFTFINREDAEDIILQIERKHDASIGVCWDTLDIYTDDFIIEKKGVIS